MISTFFLSVFNSFLNLLLGLLPTGHIPTDLSNAFVSLWGVINTFSYLIAVDTLIQVFLLAMAFDIALLVWRFINWIIRKIPGMT